MTVRADIMVVEIGGVWDGLSSPRAPMALTTDWHPDMTNTWTRGPGVGALASIPTQVAAKWDVEDAVPSDLAVEMDVILTPEIRRYMLSGGQLLSTAPGTAAANARSYRLVRPMAVGDDSLIFAHQKDNASDPGPVAGAPALPEYVYVGTECMAVESVFRVGDVAGENDPFKDHWVASVLRGQMGTIAQQHDIPAGGDLAYGPLGAAVNNQVLQTLIYPISPVILRGEAPASVVGMPLKVSRFARETGDITVLYEGLVGDVVDSGDLARITALSGVGALESALIPKTPALPPLSGQGHNALPDGLDSLWAQWPSLDGFGEFDVEVGGSPTGVRIYGATPAPTGTNNTTPVLGPLRRTFISTGPIAHELGATPGTTNKNRAKVRREPTLPGKTSYTSIPYARYLAGATAATDPAIWPSNYSMPPQYLVDSSSTSWRAIVWEGEGGVPPQSGQETNNNGYMLSKEGPGADVYTIVGLEPGPTIQQLELNWTIEADRYLYSSLGASQYKLVPPGEYPVSIRTDPLFVSANRRMAWRLADGTYAGTDWDHLANTRAGGWDRFAGETRKLPQVYTPGRVYRCPCMLDRSVTSGGAVWTPLADDLNQGGYLKYVEAIYGLAGPITSSRSGAPPGERFDFGVVYRQHNMDAQAGHNTLVTILNTFAGYLQSITYRGAGSTLQAYQRLVALVVMALEGVPYRTAADAAIINEWLELGDPIIYRQTGAWCPEVWKDRSLADILIKDWYQMLGVTWVTQTTGKIVPVWMGAEPGTLGRPTGVGDSSLDAREINVENVRSLDFSLAATDAENVSRVSLRGMNGVAVPDDYPFQLTYRGSSLPGLINPEAMPTEIEIEAWSAVGSSVGGRTLSIDVQAPYARRQGLNRLLGVRQNNALTDPSVLGVLMQWAWSRVLATIAKPDPTVILVVDDEFAGQPGQWCRVNVPGMPLPDGTLTTRDNLVPALGLILERGDNWREGTSELRVRLVGWSDARVGYL